MVFGATLSDTAPVFGDPAIALEALLELLPQPVLFADKRGRLVYANPAACALLGYPLLELRSLLHVSDVYHRPEDARRVLRAARDAGGQTERPVDVMVRTRSGEVVPARIHARVHVDAQGLIIGTMGVFEDVREVSDLSRRLDDAATQVVASEKRAAVVSVVAKAAHDLSQPLMAAMGNIELARMQPNLDAKISTRLERTYEQLERLQGIVVEFVRMTSTRSVS